MSHQIKMQHDCSVIPRLYKTAYSNSYQFWASGFNGDYSLYHSYILNSVGIIKDV